MDTKDFLHQFEWIGKLGCFIFFLALIYTVAGVVLYCIKTVI